MGVSAFFDTPKEYASFNLERIYRGLDILPSTVALKREARARWKAFCSFKFPLEQRNPWSISETRRQGPHILRRRSIFHATVFFRDASKRKKGKQKRDKKRKSANEGGKMHTAPSEISNGDLSSTRRNTNIIKSEVHILRQVFTRGIDVRCVEVWVSLRRIYIDVGKWKALQYEYRTGELIEPF